MVGYHSLMYMMSVHTFAAKHGKKGGMKVTNVNEMIMEIFEVTGFSDILTIE